MSNFSFFAFTFPLTFLFIAFTEDTQVIFGENMRSWQKILLTGLQLWDQGRKYTKNTLTEKEEHFLFVLCEIMGFFHYHNSAAVGK